MNYLNLILSLFFLNKLVLISHGQIVNNGDSSQFQQMNRQKLLDDSAFRRYRNLYVSAHTVAKMELEHYLTRKTLTEYFERKSTLIPTIAKGGNLVQYNFTEDNTQPIHESQPRYFGNDYLKAIYENKPLLSRSFMKEAINQGYPKGAQLKAFIGLNIDNLFRSYQEEWFDTGYLKFFDHFYNQSAILSNDEKCGETFDDDAFMETFVDPYCPDQCDCFMFSEDVTKCRTSCEKDIQYQSVDGKMDCEFYLILYGMKRRTAKVIFYSQRMEVCNTEHLHYKQQLYTLEHPLGGGLKMSKGIF